jgi:hypothetical protein
VAEDGRNTDNFAHFFRMADGDLHLDDAAHAVMYDTANGQVVCSLFSSIFSIGFAPVSFSQASISSWNRHFIPQSSRCPRLEKARSVPPPMVRASRFRISITFSTGKH